MRKASAFAALLFLLGVLALGQQPRAQLTATGVGGGGFGGASLCVGYTGPGDVASGAMAWWGLRAYTAATCGNKLANVCNSTGGVDVGCADMLSSTTTGALVSATVGGITCPGANCTVKVLYDLSGNANCGGVCDMNASPSIAGRPVLTASCIGSLPCFTFATSGTNYIQNATGFTQAQPVTLILAGTQTTTNAAGNIALGDNNVEIVYSTAGNDITGLCGTQSATAAAANNTYFAYTLVCAGASASILYQNGTSILSAFGNGAGAAGAKTFNFPFGTASVEGGFYASAFSSGQASSMSANQRSYWGF